MTYSQLTYHLLTYMAPADVGIASRWPLTYGLLTR